MNQISVVYPCCGAQEYWPLTAHGELEMTHDELGAMCDAQPGTFDDRMSALIAYARDLERAMCLAKLFGTGRGREHATIMSIRAQHPGVAALLDRDTAG